MFHKYRKNLTSRFVVLHLRQLVGLVTVPIRKLEHQLRDRVPRETFRLIVAWVWLPDEDWWETMSRINEKTTFNGNQWVQVTAMLGIQKGVSGCNDNVAPPQLAGCSYNPMGSKIVSLNCICLGTRPLPCCPLHLSLARLRKVCLEANWYIILFALDFVCTLSCCGVNGRFGRAGVLDMRACERCSERNVQLRSPRCGLITVCGHFTPQFVQVCSTPRTSAQSNFFQLFAFVFSCHPSWVLKLIIVSIFFAFVVPYFYLCQFRVNSYQNMLFSILVGGSQSYFFNPSQLFSILIFFLNTSRFPSPFSLDVIHSFNLIGTFSSMFNSCCKI